MSLSLSNDEISKAQLIYKNLFRCFIFNYVYQIMTSEAKNHGFFCIISK